jgi:glycine/D-amino acid oxidase-like deaminating enzyme
MFGVGAGPLADGTPLPVDYQGALPALVLPPLEGMHRADVVVVGAGFTGLSAALHLAQAGCSAVVLEGREVGWGGSGRAFGQVVPYLKNGEADVLAAFGPDWGERLIAGVAAGPDLVFRLITKHGIACEPTRRGLIIAAHATKAEPGLERRVQFWADRGADVTMLRDEAMAAQTGTRFYRVGLLDRRGGCINPLAYARGLAQAVVAAGGRVHEGCPAVSLRQEAGGWQVRTPGGEVLAPQVVLATDAYTDDLWPGLRRSIVPLRAYQLVSEPLSDNLRHSVLPGGQSLTDTRRLYSGIRLRVDGRLHVSVDGSALRNDGRPNATFATRRVQALFPHLPPLTWESSVAGWVGMTADQYPHLHRLARGLIAAIGLSGRGIAFGTLLGWEASLRVLERPESDWMMPDTPLRPLVVKPVMLPLLAGLLAYYRALDALELRRPR